MITESYFHCRVTWSVTCYPASFYTVQSGPGPSATVNKFIHLLIGGQTPVSTPPYVSHIILQVKPCLIVGNKISVVFIEHRGVITLSPRSTYSCCTLSCANTETAATCTSSIAKRTQRGLTLLCALFEELPIIFKFALFL